MTPDEYLEALLGLPALEFAEVSRDGKWVAWTWYRTGPVADVFVAPTDGSSPPVRLTETADETVVTAWTPDSRSLLVSQDRDGDERSQLFRVDLDQPGVMQPLTEPSPNFYLSGGQLHPNGRWLIYGANLDCTTGQEIEPAWLYRHDLQTGERVPLARPLRSCYYEPRLNEPGTHILYQRKDRHPAGLQVWLVDIEGRDDREIVNAGADKKVRATWLPDGQRALILAETETHQRVGVWDLASGALRWLVDDPERNIEAAYAPYGSQQAVLIEYDLSRVRASFLDLDTGEESALPEIRGSLIPLAPVGGGDWVGRYYHSQQPEDLVRFSPEDPQPERFTSLTRIWERTPLTPQDLTRSSDFRWRSVDGLEIQGWLYRPQGQARGTIVHVHGGPTWHMEDWVNAHIQYLVSQGFNVLDPNYRGSTGFSFAYREAIKEDGWGGREQEDIRTGIEALIAAGIAEPGKIGITGTSYGGYSSWWAITHFPPELVAASAPICGMTDLRVDWETTRPDMRPYSEEMMGGSPEEVPERYRERSPLYFVGDIKGALLIVQGATDPNVTPENVRVVRAALEAAGIEYELLTFDDEGHGVHRPSNQKVLYPRLAQFFGDAFASRG
jgi:dienelactone hydrolase/Tol biopolymer transport system component